MHILIPRDPYHDKFFVRRTELDMNEAIDLVESLGNRSFILDMKSTTSYTAFDFTLLADEVHETIEHLYYLSLTTVEEHGGFTSKYRIDFEKENDALMFKLGWI